MPRRHRDDCTSDSELADSNDDPFERETDADCDYTTPESGCDNEEPSQSQYQNAMAMQAADQSNDDLNQKEMRRKSAQWVRCLTDMHMPE